jgi:hypothetical protein
MEPNPYEPPNLEPNPYKAPQHYTIPRMSLGFDWIAATILLLCGFAMVVLPLTLPLERFGVVAIVCVPKGLMALFLGCLVIRLPKQRQPT